MVITQLITNRGSNTHTSKGSNTNTSNGNTNHTILMLNALARETMSSSRSGVRAKSAVSWGSSYLGA